MKIAFRTDASTKIGTGHFMRCLTLADELKKQDAQIRFLSRNLPTHLRDLLRIKGIEFIPLEAGEVDGLIDELGHASWLGISQAEDSQMTIKALSDKTWDWLVVDHYALDARWEKALRPSVKKIMVIDDLADRQHDCDTLLDQNYYADMQTRYKGKVPADCQLLLGPSYALLREEFRALREQVKVRNGEVKKVFVFFGGIDAENYTMKAIEALSAINTGLHIDVVIGAQHPYKLQIEAACGKNGFICHVQPLHIAKLMADADIAIGAGGTAIWERCCLGLPTISLCLAENQRKQIADAAGVGVLCAPTTENDLVQSILLNTKSLLQNPALILLFSNSSMKLVDGKGVLRVASFMSHDSIEISKATQNDSKSLFEWRNHPKIRNASKNSAPILWEEHQKWFDSVLNDGNRHLLIGSINKQPIGVVRFDIEGDVTEVSIYLVPNGRNFGQGKNLLSASERWLKINCPQVLKINASVLTENEASKKMFSGLGYHIKEIGFEKDL